MVPEGIKSEDLCKIRSGSGDKKDTGVDTEKKLNKVYGKKSRINFDHQILTDHGIFYPKALCNDLIFEVTLTPARQVVKGSKPLKYKLTNIQLEYEMIQSEKPAKEVIIEYGSGQELIYDRVSRNAVFMINKETDTKINIRVNAPRRSMKGLLLLFEEPYDASKRDSEKYIFPDLKKVRVTINALPNMLYNNASKARTFWSATFS